MPNINQAIQLTGTSAEQTTPHEESVFWNGSGSALTAGDWASIDVSVTTYGLGSAVKVSPASADTPTIGVVAENIPNLTWGKIRTYGYYADANVATGTAADAYIQSSGTAGRAEAAGANTQRVIGLCLELAADNKADVFICK